MRHIFDPSQGFSLERDLGIVKLVPGTDSVDATQLTGLRKMAENESGPIEDKAADSPQLMERFLELWAIRTRESDERLIQAKALLYCALPYRRTHERTITRSVSLGRTRRLSIALGATEEGIELPFGTDRVLLAWLQTRGYESGVVELSALQEYFREFGLQASGREYQRLRDSLQRLSGLCFTLEGMQGRKRIRRTYRILTPTKGNLRALEVHRRRNPGGSGRSRVLLSLDPDFWQYLRGDAVALPLDLFRAFRHRPKSWDLVAFALHRCAIAKSPSIVPWPDLVEQLGTEDRCPRRLRRSLAVVLDEIRVVYPKFPARFVRGGGLAVGPWGRD